MIEPEIVLWPQGDNPPKATLYYGQDVRETLRQLPDKSVHVICTSPPYWGLRDYGLEPTIWGGNPDCEHDWEQSELITRKGSTNGLTGSTLASKGAQKAIALSEMNNKSQQYRMDESAFCSKCGAWKGCFGLEPTPHLYVEHMVEIGQALWRVLRDDGVFWLNLGDSYMSHSAKKLDAMGGFQGNRIRDKEAYRASLGSVGKRPIPSEIGLKNKDLVGIPWRSALALQDSGWYLRQDIIWSKTNPMPESVIDRCTKSHEYIFMLTKNSKYYFDTKAIQEVASGKSMGNKTHKYVDQYKKEQSEQHRTKAGLEKIVNTEWENRNRRTIWNVATKSYRGAHFATWPPKLVEPMILAGTSEKGCCTVCGEPYRRVPEGWGLTCSCNSEDSSRCVVLDPFSGSGTTGAVALEHGRDYIGIDMNQGFLDLTKTRILGESPLPPANGKKEESVLDLF